MVIPVGLAVVFIISLTTWLGWWRPAMREEQRVAPRWTLVVPALMVVIALLNSATIDCGARDLSWVVLLALGVALVGICLLMPLGVIAAIVTARRVDRAAAPAAALPATDEVRPRGRDSRGTRPRWCSLTPSWGQPPSSRHHCR